MSQFLTQISPPQDANFYVTCLDNRLIKKTENLLVVGGWKGRVNYLCFFSHGVLSTAVQLTLLSNNLHSGP